jgi:isoamylase
MTASRLNDLVSYNDKHNEANGEDNRDGHSATTVSWNCGVPRARPTTPPIIARCASGQKRNLLATLMLSQGTPMILAGDEFGRTQQQQWQQQCLLPGQRDQLGRLGPWTGWQKTW